MEIELTIPNWNAVLDREIYGPIEVSYRQAGEYSIWNDVSGTTVYLKSGDRLRGTSPELSKLIDHNYAVEVSVPKKVDVQKPLAKKEQPGE